MSWKFIDLFAGIGGFHLAFSSLGAECVFASDWNKFARQTYEANFHLEVEGDITAVNPQTIPDFDILCAGFPCQPFSIAGVSKKNSLGRKHGFEDETQGNLFFNIMDIVDAKRPPILFLENVKNLKSHDKGNTWKVIQSNLEDRDYQVFHQIIDAKYYVPQHRERIFIICFANEIYEAIDFKFPSYPSQRRYELPEIFEPNVDKKYTLSDKLWAYLQQHKLNSQKKGNGFGFGLIDPQKDEYTRTMSARYYKDGSEILIKQDGKNPRRLTPREAARLQGFPESFVIPVSDAQAYRQFGNSVAVPAVTATAERIFETVQAYQQGEARVEYFQKKLFAL